MRLVRSGFECATTLTNSERLFGAIPTLRGCNPKRPIIFPVYASPLLFAYIRCLHRNHRSARGATLGNGGWLTPFHVGTCTRPDAPRFARPTNGYITRQPQSEASGMAGVCFCCVRQTLTEYRICCILYRTKQITI